MISVAGIIYPSLQNLQSPHGWRPTMGIGRGGDGTMLNRAWTSIFRRFFGWRVAHSGFFFENACFISGLWRLSRHLSIKWRSGEIFGLKVRIKVRCSTSLALVDGEYSFSKASSITLSGKSHLTRWYLRSSRFFWWYWVEHNLIILRPRDKAMLFFVCFGWQLVYFR